MTTYAERRALNGRLPEAHIFKLPDEVIELVGEVHGASLLQRMASACRRFRRALLHRVYRDITIPAVYGGVHPGYFTLFECLETYGRLTRTLDLWIQPKSSPSGTIIDNDLVSRLLKGLARCLQFLPKLRSLNLKLFPHGAWETGIITWEATGRIRPDSVPLTAAELSNLGKVFNGLPRGLETLRLSGFRWGNCMTAFNLTSFPYLRRFSFDLALPTRPDDRSSLFLRRSPRIIDLTLPARWEPQLPWFKHTFPTVQLEHLTIGFGETLDSDLVVKPPAHSQWLHGLTRLIRMSESTLTTLTISTFLFRAADIASHCTNLRTLTLASLDFKYSVAADTLLEDMIGALVLLPITSLLFVDCGFIPSILGRWLEYAERDHFLPALTALELPKGGMYTESDVFDNMVEISPWNHCRSLATRAWVNRWVPDVRRALEWDCLMRGLDTSRDWWEWDCSRF